jgi:hypothetical protein
MNAKKSPQQGRGCDIDVDPAAVSDPPQSLESPSRKEPQAIQQRHERVSLLTEGRNIPSQHRLCSMEVDAAACAVMHRDPNVAINALSARLFNF